MWEADRLLGALLASTLLVTACGGETNDASACTPFSACGGDLVGKWRIASTCVTKPLMNLKCGGTANLNSARVDGTVEFLADGSEITIGTVAQSVQYEFAPACLAQPCSETGAKLENAPAGGGNPADTRASCKPSGANCVCDVTTSIHTNDHDTYTVSGSRLTTTVAGASAPDVGSYCVKGNELTVSSDSGVAFKATRE